jgi:hypothetical protein
MTVWEHPGWELPPAAGAVGPFPRRDFLRIVAGDDHVELCATGDAALAVTWTDGRVRLSGEPDLTDYHTSLGGDVKPVIAELVDRVPPGTAIDFDSLPHPSAADIAAALESSGLEVSIDQHAMTAVVPLGRSFDDYLHDIGKKQRHEVRRKRRRYEEEVGPVVHETHRHVDWAFEEFIRLHRLSAGEKGDFMDPRHERMFRLLAATAGWRLDMLRIPGTDRAAACLFSYSDDEGIYLYNSAYDPGLAAASPGIAIIGTMIETAIGEGLPRFDFLKGDEEYKFRLGAEARPLYRVKATR